MQKFLAVLAAVGFASSAYARNDAASTLERAVKYAAKQHTTENMLDVPFKRGYVTLRKEPTSNGIIIVNKRGFGERGYYLDKNGRLSEEDRAALNHELDRKGGREIVIRAVRNALAERRRIESTVAHSSRKIDALLEQVKADPEHARTYSPRLAYEVTSHGPTLFVAGHDIFIGRQKYELTDAQRESVALALKP